MYRILQHASRLDSEGSNTMEAVRSEMQGVYGMGKGAAD